MSVIASYTKPSSIMAQSAEAMLEAAKRLTILKECEPHGEFESIVRDALGIPERTAQRLMQASIKYMSPQLSAKAPALALLGKTKLFELMTEDDDVLSELADGGTIAGMTLDDIDRYLADSVLFISLLIIWLLNTPNQKGVAVRKI